MDVNLEVDSIGKTVEFSYSTPLRGLSQITSFLDSTTGENVTRFFTRKFRFTLDGVKYSDWFDLTLTELQNRIHVGGFIPIKNDLIIQFQYTRAGADDSGIISVDFVTVGGLWTLEYLQILDFEGTVFEDIGFTDKYWNETWLNLMNKLYKSGIIPEYIERSDAAENQDDDYITLWKTISYFFALCIALVDKKITHLIDDEILLSDYLAQRNLLICRDESLDQFQYLAKYTYEVIRERGTLAIARIGADFLDSTPNPYHGEILRMVCFDLINDEFLFEYIRGGLYVNSNWPTHYGLVNHLQLNKTPEQTQNFVTLSKFVTIGSVALVTDSGKVVARLSSSSSISTKSIKVNDSIGYQISFFVRQTTLSNGFSVFVECTDENEFLYPTINAGTGANLTDGRLINNFQFANNVDYYWFTAAILPYNAPNLSPSIINSIAAGWHVRMTQGTKRVKIRIANNGSNYLNIWDIKMTPLLNYQTSEFVNGVDVTNVWLKNNNLSFSDTDVKNNIERYLIPEGSIVNTIMLP